MSIPNSFNPMGTQGAVQEVPLIQAAMTGYGYNEYSNEPNVRMRIYDADEYNPALGWQAWRGFMGRGSESEQMYRDNGGNSWISGQNSKGSLTLEFEREVKINAVTAHKTNNYDTATTTLTLTGIINGSEVQLAKILDMPGGVRKTGVVDSPVYCKVYKIYLESVGFAQAKDIQFDAVFKQ